jgi:hypothetical protein
VLDDSPARVIDLGPEGVGVDHEKKLASNEVFILRVDWRQSFQSKVRVRHSELRKLADHSGPTIFHSGLSFVGLPESAAVVIDSILIDEVKKKVTEWEANLTGTRRDRLPELEFGQSRSNLPVAFVWHRRVGTRWVTNITKDPNQPIDGFAVCDDESDEQVRLLRSAYESYSEEDRDMLRMMAHLAIASRPRS